MTLRFTYLFCLITLFQPVHQVAAQHKEYIYDHFNISNGLISDNVFKIFVDREGHEWIITYNGLQKYNGYEFKTYTAKPGVEGTLSSNYVVDLFEDRDGDMIVVLFDGIDIYDKETDRFTNLVSRIPFADARRDEISRQGNAVQDRSGSIWVNCNNHLIWIDSTKENSIEYQEEYKGRFVLDRDSSALWIITDQTIKKYELETRFLQITNISDIPGPEPISRLNTIFYDSQDLCWVGTPEGLFIFDDEKYRFLDPGLFLPGHRGSQGGQLGQNITSIYEDYKKDLWIASGSVLYRIGRETGEIQKLQHEFENPNSILDEQITGIHGNQTGIIWVTYLNEGFTRLTIKTEDFHSYRYRANPEEGLGGNTVRSVFRDRDGFIWVGLYNDGLDRIDPFTESITHFRHDPKNRNTICSNYISALYRDEHQRLWAGSHDYGLCYADDIYRPDIVFRRPEFLNSNDEIYHIQADSLGRVWFGTRSGLGLYDYRDGAFRWVLEGHNVQTFLFDGHTIWIASWNYGLCRLDFRPELFEAAQPVFDSTTSVFYTSDGSNGRGFITGNEGMLRNCISIYQDPGSDIWLGTYDLGLVKAVESGDGFIYKIFGTSEGAPGNAVYGVSGDNRGNIWISTEHGLGRFDPVSEQFENFYRCDGLLSNYFMWKSYFRDEGGELFFGSVDGLNYFDPEKIRRDPEHPVVRISELRIQNQLVECRDTINGEVVLWKQVTYQDTLVLSHRNSNFSFRFYAPGYRNPDQLVYAYMMSGYDKDWFINSTGNRNAVYNHLKPGTYHFRVKAMENESSWNDDFEEKVIVILPPWWKTRMAYIFYILLISGLIYLIASSLMRFLALKHELIYNEKLHQSKLMFFTNISHELKTPLSLIKAPLSEILNEKGLSTRNRKNLKVATQNADNLLNLVNELMEFRRTDSGISKLKSEPVELNSFVHDTAAQFEYIAEQKGVNFYFNIPDDKIKIWVDREKFRKIINNLLENALKYTHEGGLVTLSIIRNPLRFGFHKDYHTLFLNQVRKNLDYIGILVSDTGVGISRESLPKIFERYYQIEAEHASHHIGSGIGLALVKNLVLLHQGDIRVASERGEGTEILVLLPLGESHLSSEEKADSTEPVALKESSGEKGDAPVTLSGKVDELRKNSGHETILIVEDHDHLREYLKDNLSDEYNIIEAANGEEGLRRLAVTRPELIITDWIMPVMDGAAFIKAVRSDERSSAIPVILLTAKDELKEMQQGLDTGADQVICKPFNIQLLKSQVKSTIRNYQGRRRKFVLESTQNLEEVKKGREAYFIGELERVIREHIREPSLNAGIIARELGLSRTVLYERVRAVTGQTIGEYIQRCRLKHAIRLMLYDNVSVSEVYIMVGFSSSSYLIRLFRKYYQTTPGEYVKNYLRTASN
jgi:signal transduction histidine kinase/ligand-binding sensor domain-containing protein/DNA-binding response OmpR family regulator